MQTAIFLVKRFISFENATKAKTHQQVHRQTSHLQKKYECLVLAKSTQPISISLTVKD